ncbi:MAG: heptosyltransferase [Betaproteobacteria bacterium]|nr:heptosyltransferase [Betaproteobacteria bacterium]
MNRQTVSPKRNSRFGARALLLLRLLRPRIFLSLLRCARSTPNPAPKRILIPHCLLLGDTLLLAPLLAALRLRYPEAQIDTTVAPAYLPLFNRSPYGVRALGYDPRRRETLAALCHAADLGGGYDLAFIPGDNRYALLARALGARRIVAMDDRDSPNRGWKNYLCDAFVPWPQTPMALAEIFARLADPVYLPENAEAPAPPLPVYRIGDWPAPHCAAPTPPPPATPYAVLHLGAGSPLRHWPVERWRELAARLAGLGLTPVLSTGPNEEALAARIDPEGSYPAYPGTLDLAQLWHLLANARLLVCPDTGIAHLAKLVGVPTLCLFAQVGPELLGAGHFWKEMPFVPLGPEDFPCRDQPFLFERTLPWLRRCERFPSQCPHPAALCMESIEAATVIAAAEKLLAENWVRNCRLWETKPFLFSKFT